MQRAERTLGNAVIMVATVDEEYVVPPLRGRSIGGGRYIYHDEAQQLFDAAIQAGATAVLAPETTEWGTQRCRVLDTEGHEWSFGTYRPGNSC